MDTIRAARTTLFRPPELDPVIDAMARQVAALPQADLPLAVIGILRRGAPLADRLCERLTRDHGHPPPLRLDLAVKRYADDLTLLYPDTRLDENADLNAIDLSRHRILVVDDVLFSGHSLLKVVTFLAGKRPLELRAAVLVDRCISRLPVHADVTGIRLQLPQAFAVDCHVPPYEPDFRIELAPVNPAP